MLTTIIARKALRENSLFQQNSGKQFVELAYEVLSNCEGEHQFGSYCHYLWRDTFGKCGDPFLSKDVPQDCHTSHARIKGLVLDPRLHHIEGVCHHDGA